MTDKIATRLAGLETIIERGRTSFIEVGKALAAIKAEGLYREEFGTFEEYCQERWGFGKRYANLIIGSAETVASLQEGTVVPTTERQARQLSKVPAEKRAEVMEAAARTAATEGRSLNANDIAAAAAPTAPAAPLAEYQGEPDEIPDRPETGAATTNDDDAIEARFRTMVRNAVCHRLIYIDDGKCSRKEAFKLMAHSAVATCTDESLRSAEVYRGCPRHELTGWINQEDRTSTELMRLVFEVTVMGVPGFQWNTACTLADVDQKFLMEVASR